MDEYILPGTTIDRYWSDAVRLKNIHVPAVEEINDPVDFILFSIIEVICFKKPALSITPPKIIAEITNQIVFNIPNIPLDDNKFETNSFEESIDIDPYKEVIVPENNAFHDFVSKFETSKTKLVWNIKAKTEPKITPINKAGTALIFLYIKTMTMMGTINKTGEI